VNTATILKRSELEHGAESAAARLPGLLVAAQRIAANVVLGAHGRRRPGIGESFWQFRPYTSDDTPQTIDWRQSAKSDALFVKEREWVSAQTVCLWADLSPSMHFRSDKNLPTKADRAATLSLALGILLIEAGEKIVRLGIDGAVRPGATAGRLALSQMAERLALDIGTEQAPGFPAFPGSLPRHGTTVLVSDFLQPVPEIAAALNVFSERGQSLHLVQVLDPAEETLPFSGRVRFEGLENEGEMVIDRAEDARAEYRGKLAAHRDGLRTLAATHGWSFAVHRTDAAPHLTLVALHRAIGDRQR